MATRVSMEAPAAAGAEPQRDRAVARDAAGGPGAAPRDVARIGFPFIGDLVGGSYTGALMLIDHLDRRCFEPVIVLHEEGRFAADLRARGIPYRVVDLPAYVGSGRNVAAHAWTLVRTVPRLLRFLREERIVIVHANESPLYQTWAVPARLAGCALVWHQRGKLTGSRLEAATRALADRVICVSDYVARQLPPSLRDRSLVIDSPFLTACTAGETDSARRRLIEELGLDPGTPIVGFFGNLLEVKRPEVFVDAAARIHDALAGRVAFVVFGDDREGRIPGLSARAEQRGLGGALRFMGFRSPGTYWIGACDLLLAPAVGDAFPRTLVEAAVAGVLIVGADAGGHPEIISHGETGLLVPPEDPYAMAEAALTLLQDKARAAAIAHAAQQAARRRFSADQHARRVEAVYEEILAGRPPGAALRPAP